MNLLPHCAESKAIRERLGFNNTSSAKTDRSSGGYGKRDGG
jgi:hypothetical protein